VAPGQPFEAHFVDLNNDGKLEIIASAFDTRYAQSYYSITRANFFSCCTNKKVSQNFTTWVKACGSVLIAVWELKLETRPCVHNIMKISMQRQGRRLALRLHSIRQSYVALARQAPRDGRAKSHPCYHVGNFMCNSCVY
jgi:hypothetical protein